MSCLNAYNPTNNKENYVIDIAKKIYTLPNGNDGTVKIDVSMLKKNTTILRMNTLKHH